MGFFATLINGYKIMGQEAGKYVSTNRAQIASGVSIIGTIVSNILSTKAGAKSARAIDAKASEIGRPLTTKEKIQLCWQNHVVPGATAVGSCVSAAYSNNQHVKNFNKAATAYGTLKSLYDSTQKATREVLGEKKTKEVQDKVNQKYIEEHPETKERIISTKGNPDPHTMQKYWEPVSGEVFYSTRDRIENAIKAMNEKMKAMPNRNKNAAGRSGVYGIPLRMFHELANPYITEEKLCSQVMNKMGFNKGSKDSDDDVIAVYYTPMLINDDEECCIAINWEQDPSDMAYGDYCKL